MSGKKLRSTGWDSLKGNLCKNYWQLGSILISCVLKEFSLHRRVTSCPSTVHADIKEMTLSKALMDRDISGPQLYIFKDKENKIFIDISKQVVGMNLRCHHIYTHARSHHTSRS